MEARRCTTSRRCIRLRLTASEMLAVRKYQIMSIYQPYRALSLPERYRLYSALMFVGLIFVYLLFPAEKLVVKLENMV